MVCFKYFRGLGPTLIAGLLFILLEKPALIISSVFDANLCGPTRFLPPRSLGPNRTTYWSMMLLLLSYWLLLSLPTSYWWVVALLTAVSRVVNTCTS